MASPAQIARLHVGSLFDLEPGGRIRGVREPDPPPPPRFFLFRGAGLVVAHVSAGLPSPLAEELLAPAASKPPLAEPSPSHLDAYRALLAAHQSIERQYAGPAFYLPAPAALQPAGVAIDAANRD